MGNIFNKFGKHRFNKIDQRELLEFNDTTYSQYGNSTSNDINDIIKYIEVLRSELSQTKKSEEELVEKVHKMHIEYSNNIYKLNEEIDILKNDLKTLLENDKKLQDSIQENLIQDFKTGQLQSEFIESSADHIELQVS